MNKTRMGKRAASLLLSLVMMLSLLPTAAYAAMADGVDTQGAIVSENGTGVSDDSNSSGNTDDLQVGDSKDSGNTGDQQVGGSSGSGTADDTTGAEGGADPADSVNGNDSADPQDDGDAVLPTATTVVSTSEELVAAIAAASDGDTITLGEGEFTTYGNTSPKKSLTFEGVGTNTVWTIGDLNQDAKGEGNGDCSFEGCETITFKNMTLKVDNKNYRGFIRINNTVVENCTLEGRTAYWGYETAKFVNATFNAPEGDYALWDYSIKAMTFEGCTFNISGKGVNVYVEAANADKDVTRTVAVNNCTVNSSAEGKAFLNIKNSTQSYDVTLSGRNTVTGLAKDSTTGSELYQVETTEVTETTGNPVTVKQENTAGEFETIYEVKKTEKAYVAEVNGIQYETLQAAIDAAAKNATVTLLADTRENVTISTYGLTLDLNGHTLNGGTVAGKPALTVKNRVTVKDSSAAQTGTIMREDTAENSGVSSHYVIDIQDGWLFFESGSVTNNSGVVGVKGASLVRVGDDSVAKYPGLTISGGTFTQDNFIVIKVDRGTFYLKEDGTLNSKNSYAVENWKFAEIKGGTVNGTVAAWTYSGGHNSDLTISGGTVNGNVLSVNYGSAEGKVAKVSITGGTVNGALDTRSYDPSTNELTSIDDATKATIKVTGGTFNKSIPDGYCADGFIPTKNTDGTYGVKEGQYVAKVGSTKYETLADAIRLAAKGQTVKLLADVADCGSLTISKNITLDGGGHTISGNSSISVNMPGNAAADVTIKNVNFKDIANGNKLSAFYFSQVKGKLTITGCTFDSIEYEAIQVTPMEGAEVNVSSNVFKAKADGTQVRHIHIEMAYGSGFDCEGQNIKLTVTDNQLHGTVSGDASMGIWWVGTDSTLKVDGNYMEHPETVSITLSNGGVHYNRGDLIYPARSQADADVDDLIPAVIVADKASGESKIKAYSTLAEAVAAAQDGQTVRLLADVAESSIKVNANITIDLNKMTVTGSFVTYGEVTIQNGTIDVPDGKTNYAYGKLTLADVDITGKAASSSLLSVNYNGSVTIDKDSTIVADSEQGHFPAVFIKGQDDSGKTYAPELNIYGTVQSAKTPAIQGNGTDRGVSHVNVFEGAVVKSETLAIYLPQPCEVNITGGLVEGYCGIGIKSGTLNISGGTVRGVAKDNVIGDEYSQTNGISYDGSAIMIDSYIGYAGQVQINISGNAVVESKYSTAIREIGNDKSQTNLVGLDITGGTVLGAKDTDAVLVRDVTAKDVNISGGEFSSIVKKEYCAPGFTPVTTANSEGRYGVEIGMFTVKVTSRTTGSDSPVANVAGGGSNITYAQGTKVTASAISGYKFVGWFVNEYTGTPYSTDLACEVKPTADCTMIAVYEPISGGKFWLTVTASEFTVNGGAVQDSYLYEQFAVGASVTVNFTGSENFLYWVNESGKVVSTSKTYTFSMGSATTLKAVYAEKEENQAMVVFISHTQQVISSKSYTDTQEIQFPEPPIKMGATFVRWSMTEAEIRAAMATTATGIIVVEPVYEFNAGSYTVTVNYPNDDTATYTATVGKITTVTAKSIDGKVFKCWKNGDTVLGYTETLRIAPRGDLTLTAEYVDAGTTVDRLPVIALTEISASQQGAKYAVSFTATRSVPEGYTVTEQGILVSTNSQYGQEGALDAMKLDANGAKPDDTFILKATNTDATGVTVLNGTVSAADRTVYGRAYMILRDSSGAMVYVYSDTILSGSYNSLTTNGGN